jgi:hypothetical protein
MTDVRPDERYGLYTIREGDGLVELAVCGKDGIGQAIVTLAAEGEFTDRCDRQTPLGIRDRVNRTWVRHPFHGASV